MFCSEVLKSYWSCITKFCIILISSTASSVFKKQTCLVAVGSSERPASTGAADLFFSKGSVTLMDDTGAEAGEEDYSTDFFETLFRSLTSVSDLVFLAQLQSGMSLCVGIYQKTLLLAWCAATRKLYY